MRRKRRSKKPWYHLIQTRTWILVWALLLASMSVAYTTYRQTQSLQRPLQVQVLNGSGVEGLARGAADRLRSPDIDVVLVANADDSDYKGTLVLLRRGSMSSAQHLVEELGLGMAILQLDPTLLVDATIVLGHDYARRHSGDGAASFSRR